MRAGLSRLAAGLILLLTTGASAEDIAVTAAQIKEFQGQQVGGSVGGLIWRGGIELESPAASFGGLSGLTYVGTEGQLVMVTDRGNFVSGQLLYDDMLRPFELVGVTISAIQNSKGADLPRAFARDAEAVHVIMRDGAPAAVRVGFENLTRVADFELVDGVPKGAAREVAIPEWLSAKRTNQSLEAVCIAPPASPIAGSTLLLTEGVETADGQHSAWLLGNNDKGALALTVSPGVNPTDCAFLPNGDLLVLQRGLNLFSFAMVLKRIRAADVHPGALMDGEVLLQAGGGDVDNMEAVAVHTAPDGETRITLASDNNFRTWERTLMLEFALPE